ncbi:MAG: CC0125/CC1285 family lipoprotein [Geminicoccaceae bacterium]
MSIMLSFSVRVLRWLLAAPLLLMLGACATETPYQPGEGRYGYSEQQIEKDRYRVIFSGNPSTPRETVQNYLLYRSAELTVQNGFDYFTVVDRDVERSTRYYSQGYVDDFGFRDRFRGRSSRRRFLFPSYYSSNAYPVSEYSGIADIVMGEGEKPEGDANAYDALDVLQQLQPLVRQAEK